MEQNQNPRGSQQLPTTNSQPTTSSKHFKAFWPIVLIATMSAVIGGLVVWAAFNAGLDEELNSLLPGADRKIARQHKNFEIQPMTSQANESAADWQTYRNEEHGFEFKYDPKKFEFESTGQFEVTPNSWNIEVILSLFDKESKQVVEECNCGEYERFQVRVWPDTEKSSIDEYVKNHTPQAFWNTIKNVSVSGVEAREVEGIGRQIYLIRKGYIYQITPIDSILSTFKFTK